MAILAIPRQTDKEIIKVFKRIFDKYSEHITGCAVNTVPGVRFQNIFKDETYKEIEKHNSSIINTFSISITNFNVNYYRGGSRQEKSPFIDEVNIDSNISNRELECPLSENEKIDITVLLSKGLKVLDPKRTVKGTLSQEQNDLLSIHQETLTRLETLNVELVSGSEEFRKNLEIEFRDKKEQLETTYNKTIGEKQNELNKLKQDLEVKLKEVDDRNNTHVRRQLRQNILDEIRNRSTEFKLTEGTSRLRIPIHIACIIIIFLFGFVAWSYSKESFNYLNSDPFNLTAFVILAFKQIAFAVASVGTAVFYIKWLNRWFDQHSHTEFNLKQFQLDIERASWIVETSLEWDDERKGPIPKELIQQLTKNLFEYDKVKSDPVKHPSDQLASALLGTASKVKVQAGNTQLEYVGKNLKKQMSSEK